MNEARKYVAVSIKHTEYKWKFGKPCVLWGFHQTGDDEPRCFAGYTEYLSKAERYALGEFRARGYGSEILDKAPVSMSADFCKKWKAYDTVLVDAEKYYHYCMLVGIPIDPPKEDPYGV